MIEFINDRRVAEVMGTEGWRRMQAAHPALVNEAYQRLASQQALPMGPPRRRGKK